MSGGYLAGALTVQDGDTVTLDDGSAVGTTLLNGDTITIEQGLLRHLTETSIYSELVVSDGGRLLSASVEFGTVEVASGGVASSVTLGFKSGYNYDQKLTVQQGETLVSTIVYAGTLSLGAGAVALDVAVLSGGEIDLVAASGFDATVALAQGAVMGIAVPYMAGASVSLDSATDVLTLSEGSSSVSLQLAGDYSSDAFVVSSFAARPDETGIFVVGSARVISSGVTKHLDYAATTSASFSSATDWLIVTEGSTSVTLQLAGTYAGISFVLKSNGVKRDPGTLVRTIMAAGSVVPSSLAAEVRVLGSSIRVAPPSALGAHDAQLDGSAPALPGSHPTLIDYAEHGMLTAMHVP